MWADALQHTALQSLAADVASERIPAQGYAGMGVQNLSPYVVQLVADTGRVLLRVPPWTQSTHTPDVPCSYVIAQTVLAASPAALATVLQQYQVRVLLTHAALPERMEPLASSAALLGSLAPKAVYTSQQSIDYSAMSTASTTYYFLFQVLHRNASARLVSAIGGSTSNKLNQYVTVGFFVADSTFLQYVAGSGSTENSLSDWRNLPGPTMVANIGLGNYTATDTSASDSLLGMPGDTLVVKVETGTTAPTAGDVLLNVIEIV